MGVGGWDPTAIASLEKEMQDYVKQDGKKATPMTIIDKIQTRLDMWRHEGNIDFPKTPRMPEKQQFSF